jgi:hypothetical protein
LQNEPVTGSWQLLKIHVLAQSVVRHLGCSVQTWGQIRTCFEFILNIVKFKHFFSQKITELLTSHPGRIHFDFGASATLMLLQFLHSLRGKHVKVLPTATCHIPSNL